MKPHQDREYASSVTLMVLGEGLDPDRVSAELHLEPSQYWRKGERSVRFRGGTTRLRKSVHEWGGWKLFVAAEHKDECLEEQLEFWIYLLRSRIAGLRQLRLVGLKCALDVLVLSSETASIVLSNQLQKEVAALGLEMRISFWASPESDQAAAGDAGNPGV